MADECSFCAERRSTAIVLDDVFLAHTDCKGNNLRDVIIAHVISADAQIHRDIQTRKRQSNLRTARGRLVKRIACMEVIHAQNQGV